MCHENSAFFQSVGRAVYNTTRDSRKQRINVTMGLLSIESLVRFNSIIFESLFSIKSVLKQECPASVHPLNEILIREHEQSPLMKTKQYTLCALAIDKPSFE